MNFDAKNLIEDLRKQFSDDNLYALMNELRDYFSQKITQDENVIKFNLATTNRADTWVPACGGNEKVFTKNGRQLIYSYNPARDEHAYYDVDKDLVLSPQEVDKIF